MNLGRILATVAFVAVAFITSAQVSQPTMMVQTLDTLVNETSGVVFLNGKLWTHNDSGNEAEIYSIDTITGQVNDTKIISGVTNEDWEDMANDDTYIYIGNFGSMSVNKQIVRIKIEDLENPNLNTLTPEIINFNYGNPDYSESDYGSTETRFDCEAMIVKDDTIFLFSKNWVDYKTFLYAIPNETNILHTILPTDTLELDYLVTGADYDYESNTIALVGYTYSSMNSKPHITLLTDFEGNNFFSGNHTNQEFSSPSSLTNQEEGITFNQIEAVVFRDKGRLWVTNEKFERTISRYTLTINPHLREFKISNSLSENDFHKNNKKKASVFPNPANEMISIENNDDFSFEIINSKGVIVMKSHKKISSGTTTDISFIPAGNYILRVIGKTETNEIKFVKL